MTGRAVRYAFAVAAVLLMFAAPAFAEAAVGDVYGVEEHAFTNIPGGIFRLGPQGGDAQTIASGPPFAHPSGMTEGPDGKLLVGDYGAGTVFKVDPATGATSPLVSGPPLHTNAGPGDVAFAPDGSLLVSDYGGTFFGGTGSLFRVDPQSGAVTTVASGPPFVDPGGIAVTHDGIAFVSDLGANAVFEVNLATGAIGTLASGPQLQEADGIALSADERSLYVAAFGSNQVVRIDPSSGAMTTVATLADAVSVGFLQDGSLLVGDPAENRILRMPPSGSPVTTFSDDSELDWPHDFVVEPGTCDGKVPMRVGTDASERVPGSAFADVVSTLGGDDRFSGSDGNDVACGGAGRDKLKGGRGRDVLIGGAGRDKCISGPGKDVIRGCEVKR